MYTIVDGIQTIPLVK